MNPLQTATLVLNLLTLAVLLVTLVMLLTALKKERRRR